MEGSPCRHEEGGAQQDAGRDAEVGRVEQAIAVGVAGKEGLDAHVVHAGVAGGVDLQAGAINAALVPQQLEKLTVAAAQVRRPQLEFASR